MMNTKETMLRLLKTEHFTFEDLCDLVSVLRSDIGCPWDREQTNKSIRNCIIDETYEFIEGLDNDDDKLMCEELGDVLFQVVFHSDIKSDEKAFNSNDVIDGICKKMILRHPHVFGDVSVENSKEVLVNWDNIKNDEKSRRTPYEQLDAVSKSLPALMRAQKLRSKAAKNNLIEKPDHNECLDRIIEAANKLKNGCDNNTIGELLFAAVGVASANDVEAEEVLYRFNEEFQEKFK